MKRFILAVLIASISIIGLGGIIETAGARFKSDDKALTLIKQARQAIGGDSEIQKIKSMTIIGKTTKILDLEGTSKSEQGDLEINFQIPDKFQKMLKIGQADGSAVEERKIDVVILNKGTDAKTVKGSNDGKEVIEVTIDDNDHKRMSEKTIDGKKILVRNDVNVTHGDEKMRHNEMLKTTLFLLLTAPEGVDVRYTYAGEGNVDGTVCDIIDAASNGETFKLYLDKSSHLPKMMSYTGLKPFAVNLKRTENKNVEKNLKEVRVRAFTTEADTAEFQVKFSDFRKVNGLQFPFKWSQTSGGKDDEITNITNYSLNPAGIDAKFKEHETKVMVRTKKPE